MKPIVVSAIALMIADTNDGGWPHRATGRALAHHVVDLPECVSDELLPLFGDAVRHRQLPRRPGYRR
jgi:hypothetical protein